MTPLERTVTLLKSSPSERELATRLRPIILKLGPERARRVARAAWEQLSLAEQAALAAKWLREEMN
jgi:hypothetical protein